MITGMHAAAYAGPIKADDNARLITDNNGFITSDWSSVEYITVSEYIDKYGGESEVNDAFNHAELHHEAMLMEAAGDIEGSAALLAEDTALSDDKPNDLLLSLKEGKFLGMEIESISDLPPTNTNLSIRVKGDAAPNVTYAGVSEVNAVMSEASGTNVLNGTHTDGSVYRVLYTDAYPSASDINNQLYEPQSGSYFYKYGYSWKGDYRCTTDLTVTNNTKLYSVEQDVVMYAFIGAVTNAAAGDHAIDFGFIASPTASNRNQGLYAVRNIDRGTIWDVEAYPKVNISGTTTNPMTLEPKTVRLQLTIDTLGNVETVMYVGTSMIYYKTQNISGFVSGNNAALTFFQAMSCVDPDGVYTQPNSGSYFNNVTFSDTKLYSYTGGERAFGTYGDDTYCVYICKPENVSYAYGPNTETISIEYTN